MVATQTSTLRQIGWRALIAPVVMFALVFVTAGRLDYWQGWVYTLVNIAILAITAVAMQRQPQLIQERLRPGAGMKQWDKVYFALSTPLYLIFLIVSALDTGRFGWTAELPTAVVVGGLLLYVLGQGLFLWAKLTNRYFSSVVRIQTEQGHTVCREGPYRWVRHPGYVGGLLFGVSAPLMLGSLWGLLPSLMAGLLLIVRTYLEDQTLQAELAGYRAYASEVRYRLVPGVW